VVGVSDGNAVVVDKYKYTAYGEKRAGTSVGVKQPYGYTAREGIGSTGLYYYRSRVYDAGRGRFVREDDWFKELAVRNAENKFDEVNWYGYVGGNPVIHSDAFGFSKWICTKSESYIVNKRVCVLYYGEGPNMGDCMEYEWVGEVKTRCIEGYYENEWHDPITDSWGKISGETTSSDGNDHTGVRDGSSDCPDRASGSGYNEPDPIKKPWWKRLWDFFFGDPTYIYQSEKIFY